jgi:hypothetical protein
MREAALLPGPVDAAIPGRALSCRECPLLSGISAGPDEYARVLLFGHECGGLRVVLRFPRSWVRRGVSLLVGGGRKRGSGGKTWNRAVFFGAGGVPGFPPSAFPDWSPLLSDYSCSRAVVFLTSLSCLVEGVRSGTRRRHPLNPSPLVSGCAAAGPGRTAPVHADTPLSRRSAAGVRPLSERGRASVRTPGRALSSGRAAR